MPDARSPLAIQTTHASGWRSQNFCASAIVARAAENASPALISTFGADCEPPLGSKTNTTPNQNANRNRKRMTYPVPRGFYQPHSRAP